MIRYRHFRKFPHDQRGSASVFCICLLPMVLALGGLAIDGANAWRVRTMLQATADAAALAAVVDLPNVNNAAVDAQSYAAKNMPSTTNGDVLATADVTTGSWDSNARVFSAGGTPLNAVQVTVRRAAANGNSLPTTFLSLIGVNSWNIVTTAIATKNATNIDFYLLLDDSPSMAIAATQSGITTMVNNTASQGGCAFGCHESHPVTDNLGNPGGEDNYTLARNLGVALRIDTLQQATQDLMTTAQQTENTSLSQYRMALYTFDLGLNTIQTLTSSLAAVQSEAANIAVLEVYANNWLTASNNNNDEDTNYDNSMNNINLIMPNPGRGTNAKGDTPQEVLFFVTDGVEDEDVNGNRQQSVMNSTWCTTIKNRGVRIAVLYTSYLPLPTNAWYNTWVAPFQNNIGPNLQSCASPGLYFEVQTGGDISAAMSALFKAAVATASLSQ